MEEEIDRQIRVDLAVMQTLYQFVVVKRKPSVKANQLIFLLIYSRYGKYSDPVNFYTICYIAAIC